MKKYAFLLFLFVVALSAFTTKRTEPSALIGCWSFVEFNEGFHWEKTPTIKAGNAGYAFRSDGTLIKRHPKNWEEDPPVMFDDIPGTWKMLNADKIELYYDFPDGGHVKETVLIKRLEDGKMVWERLDWEEIRE